MMTRRWSPLAFLHPPASSLDPRPGEPAPANGAAVACLLAGGVGWATVGLVAGCVAAWPHVGILLAYAPTSGPVSGILTLALLVWAGTWANLYRRWRGRRLDAGLAMAGLVALVTWGAGGMVTCAWWRCLALVSPP